MIFLPVGEVSLNDDEYIQLILAEFKKEKKNKFDRNALT